MRDVKGAKGELRTIAYFVVGALALVGIGSVLWIFLFVLHTNLTGG